MLLWVTVLAMAGAVVALFERRLDERTLSASLGAQAALALGFYAFLLFASNPFARLDPAPLEGRGLNPLAPGPRPRLPSADALPRLCRPVGRVQPRRRRAAHAARSMPGAGAGDAAVGAGAWIFLTLGITAGSYWAYYELGWGGWWFWDPVENASLMPWLAATALAPQVNVLAARGGFARGR
jgi:cytochrome c-type biogenesis protein CcmF